MSKATSKKKSSSLFDDEEEFVLPTDVISLQDLAHTYWMQFFRPKEPLSLTDKKAVINRYNQIAEAINKQRPGSIVKLTMSTQWIPTKMYEQDIADDKPTVKAPGHSNTNPAPVNSKPDKSKEPTAPVKKPQANGNTEESPAGGNKIQQIIALHKAGKSNKEIIEAGYNKSTVARQVSEYKKKNGGK